MEKQNCWEFKKCGRHPGGDKVGALGECPAPTESRTDGMNDGKNGGRSCWAISGTLCGGEKQGTFAQKLLNCSQCDFYKIVMQEEGKRVQLAQKILKKLAT